MIAQPYIDQPAATAVVEARVRKAESTAIVRRSDTRIDRLLDTLRIDDEAPPWPGSSQPREYLSIQEIREMGEQVSEYRGVGARTTLAATAQVSQVITASTTGLVLHPSDIIINVDDEIRSALFSADRSIEVMFPGILEEMNRILGG